MQRRTSAGFFVLAVGTAAALVPMVALSDYWVTSPTSDSAVLALTLVGTAYLVDAVATDRGWATNAGTSIAISTLMVMLRPTMAVFAAMVDPRPGGARFARPWATRVPVAAGGPGR